MSNLSQFGASRWITNPKHLVNVSVQNDKLGLKNTLTTQQLSDAASFFTTIATRGASASITVADTYVTLCDLTGAGFMVNAISPTHTASFTPTIRITVDGIAYTIAPSAAQTAYYRFVLGTLTNYLSIVSVSTAAVAGDIISPNSAQDSGFAGSRTGGVVQASTNGVLGVPSPDAALSYGFPVLRFESSLKVEVKCSDLSGTAADKQCGVTYRLDL